MNTIAPVRAIDYGANIHIYHANKGDGLPRHEHVYAHLTMSHAGSCVVRKEKGERILTKNSMPLDLIGGEWHEIEALEDGTIFVNVHKQF